MGNPKTELILTKTAKVISIAFHPLFMPLYGLIIIFSAPTLFGYLPANVKRILFFIVLINNVLLPISLLPYLRYRNHITSWSLENRKERMLPLFIATILYAATSYIIIRYPVPVFYKDIHSRYIHNITLCYCNKSLVEDFYPFSGSRLNCSPCTCAFNKNEFNIALAASSGNNWFRAYPFCKVKT